MKESMKKTKEEEDSERVVKTVVKKQTLEINLSELENQNYIYDAKKTVESQQNTSLMSHDLRSKLLNLSDHKEATLGIHGSEIGVQEVEVDQRQQYTIANSVFDPRIRSAQNTTNEENNTVSLRQSDQSSKLYGSIAISQNKLNSMAVSAHQMANMGAPRFGHHRASQEAQNTVIFSNLNQMANQTFGNMKINRNSQEYATEVNRQQNLLQESSSEVASQFTASIQNKTPAFSQMNLSDYQNQIPQAMQQQLNHLDGQQIQGQPSNIRSYPVQGNMYQIAKGQQNITEHQPRPPTTYLLNIRDPAIQNQHNARIMQIQATVPSPNPDYQCQQMPQSNRLKFSKKQNSNRFKSQNRLSGKSSENQKRFKQPNVQNRDINNEFMDRTGAGTVQGAKSRPRTSQLQKPRTVSSVIENYNQNESIATEFSVHNNFKKRRQKSAASYSTHRKHSIDKRSTENSTNLPLHSLDGKKIQLVPISQRVKQIAEKNRKKFGKKQMDQTNEYDQNQAKQPQQTSGIETHGEIVDSKLGSAQDEQMTTALEQKNKPNVESKNSLSSIQNQEQPLQVQYQEGKTANFDGNQSQTPSAVPNDLTGRRQNMSVSTTQEHLDHGISTQMANPIKTPIEVQQDQQLPTLAQVSTSQRINELNRNKSFYDEIDELQTDAKEVHIKVSAENSSAQRTLRKAQKDRMPDPNLTSFGNQSESQLNVDRKSKKKKSEGKAGTITEQNKHDMTFYESNWRSQNSNMNNVDLDVDEMESNALQKKFRPRISRLKSTKGQQKLINVRQNFQRVASSPLKNRGFPRQHQIISPSRREFETFAEGSDDDMPMFQGPTTLPREPTSPPKLKVNAGSGIHVTDDDGNNTDATIKQFELNQEIQSYEKLLHPVNFQQLRLIEDRLSNEPIEEQEEDCIDDLARVNLILIDPGSQIELNQLIWKARLKSSHNESKPKTVIESEQSPLRIYQQSPESQRGRSTYKQNLIKGRIKTQSQERSEIMQRDSVKEIFNNFRSNKKYSQRISASNNSNNNSRIQDEYVDLTQAQEEQKSMVSGKSFEFKKVINTNLEDAEGGFKYDSMKQYPQMLSVTNQKDRKVIVSINEQQHHSQVNIRKGSLKNIETDQKENVATDGQQKIKEAVSKHYTDLVSPLEVQNRMQNTKLEPLSPLDKINEDKKVGASNNEVKFRISSSINRKNIISMNMSQKSPFTSKHFTQQSQVQSDQQLESKLKQEQEKKKNFQVQIQTKRKPTQDAELLDQIYESAENGGTAIGLFSGTLVQIYDLKKIIKYFQHQIEQQNKQPTLKKFDKPLFISLVDGSFVELKQLIQQQIRLNNQLRKAKKKEQARQQSQNLNLDLVTDSNKTKNQVSKKSSSGKRQTRDSKSQDHHRYSFDEKHRYFIDKKLSVLQQNGSEMAPIKRYRIVNLDGSVYTSKALIRQSIDMLRRFQGRKNHLMFMNKNHLELNDRGEGERETIIKFYNGIKNNGGKTILTEEMKAVRFQSVLTFGSQNAFNICKQSCRGSGSSLNRLLRLKSTSNSRGRKHLLNKTDYQQSPEFRKYFMYSTLQFPESSRNEQGMRNMGADPMTVKKIILKEKTSIQQIKQQEQERKTTVEVSVDQQEMIQVKSQQQKFITDQSGQQSVKDMSFNIKKSKIKISDFVPKGMRSDAAYDTTIQYGQESQILEATQSANSIQRAKVVGKKQMTDTSILADSSKQIEQNTLYQQNSLTTNKIKVGQLDKEILDQNESYPGKITNQVINNNRIKFSKNCVQWNKKSNENLGNVKEASDIKRIQSFQENSKGDQSVSQSKQIDMQHPQKPKQSQSFTLYQGKLLNAATQFSGQQLKAVKSDLSPALIPENSEVDLAQNSLHETKDVLEATNEVYAMAAHTGGHPSKDSDNKLKEDVHQAKSANIFVSKSDKFLLGEQQLQKQLIQHQKSQQLDQNSTFDQKSSQMKISRKNIKIKMSKLQLNQNQFNENSHEIIVFANDQPEEENPKPTQLTQEDNQMSPEFLRPRNNSRASKATNRLVDSQSVHTGHSQSQDNMPMILHKATINQIEDDALENSKNEPKMEGWPIDAEKDKVNKSISIMKTLQSDKEHIMSDEHNVASPNIQTANLSQLEQNADEEKLEQLNQIKAQTSQMNFHRSDSIKFQKINQFGKPQYLTNHESRRSFATKVPGSGTTIKGAFNNRTSILKNSSTTRQSSRDSKFNKRKYVYNNENNKNKLNVQMLKSKAAFEPTIRGRKRNSIDVMTLERVSGVSQEEIVRSNKNSTSATANLANQGYQSLTQIQRQLRNQNREQFTFQKRHSQASQSEINPKMEFDDDLVKLLSSIYVYQNKLADEMGEAHIATDNFESLEVKDQLQTQTIISENQTLVRPNNTLNPDCYPEENGKIDEQNEQLNQFLKEYQDQFKQEAEILNEIEAFGQKKFNRRSAHRKKLNEINHQKRKMMVFSRKESENNMMKQEYMLERRPQSAMGTQFKQITPLMHTISDLKLNKSDKRKGTERSTENNQGYNDFGMDPIPPEIDEKTSRLKEQQYEKYQRILKQHREYLNVKYDKQKSAKKDSQSNYDYKFDKLEDIAPSIGVNHKTQVRKQIQFQVDSNTQVVSKQVALAAQDNQSMVSNPAAIALSRLKPSKLDVTAPQVCDQGDINLQAIVPAPNIVINPNKSKHLKSRSYGGHHDDQLQKYNHHQRKLSQILKNDESKIEQQMQMSNFIEGNKFKRILITAIDSKDGVAGRRVKSKKQVDEVEVQGPLGSYKIYTNPSNVVRRYSSMYHY